MTTTTVDARSSLGQQELDDHLAAAAARHAVPGAGVGVLQDGRELRATTGVTSIDNPLAVDADTLFMLGSMGKTFTATAIMRLVDAGRIDLDAPVRTYIPDLVLADEEATRDVKVIHLLTHTAGWLGDWFVDTGEGDDARERLAQRLREAPQLTPVGTVVSYNNSAFALAGRVIEVVTGAVYEDAMRQLLFEPLGLDHSFFSHQDIMTRRFVAGHLVTADGPTVMRRAPGSIFPGPTLMRSAAATGGIWSTVGDVLRYARLHLGRGVVDGRRLVSEALAVRMQRPTSELSGVSIAAPWWIRDAGGIRLVGHGGNYSNAQIADLQLAPERDFAVVVLTNSGGGAALGADVVAWVLRRCLDTAVEETPVIELDASGVADYAGTYANPLGGHLDVRVDNGVAVLQTTPPPGLPEGIAVGPSEPVQLLFSRPDAFSYKTAGSDPAALDPKRGHGDFVRGSGGAVEWLRLGVRICRRIPDTERDHGGG